MKSRIFFAALAITALSANAQWPSGPEGELPIYPDGTSSPDVTLCGAPDGNTWLWMPHNKTDEDGEFGVEYSCQIYNPEGKTLLGKEPQQVSFFPYQSWWMFQARNIFIDNDNNCIFGVQDCRVSTLSHSASVYKISPTGEQLWGKDGVTVTGNEENGLLVSFGGIELEDGSYVFSWTASMDYETTFWVSTTRVSADGKIISGPNKVNLSTSTVPQSYMYCWPVNAGNNQYYLVYLEGSGYLMKAMKFDFDGTPVWGKPVEIYNGGFGSSPPWFKVSFQPTNDGGLLASWYDDRNNTNFEDPYLAYVKPDGSLGFNVKNGLRLDYQEWTRDFDVRVVYDDKTESFVAVYSSESQAQSWGTLKAQRISKNGDLLWGEEGLVIGETIEGGYGYLNVVLGEPGRVAFFYEMHTDAAAREITNYVQYYDVETGKPVWKEPTTFGTFSSPKSDLQSVNCGEFWTAAWQSQVLVDGKYTSQNENYFLQRINFDGTVGNGGSGIETITNDKAPMNYSINGRQVSFDKDANVFDLSGRQVASGRQATLAPGVYMGSDGDNVAKFIIR